jgi:4-amino-4-deoxy-L-arabinose transferase-like glycosyltransferase
MTRLDRLALPVVVGLAALLRLPGLADRGRFDADQGHDMLTLVAFTRDGVIPLLGPKTSVGEFHHGAFYYYLLAPAAAISNGDPVAVTAFIALLGIGAVALTWWLARSIATRMAGPATGSVAGLLAGLLLAASPAAIDESTFIWNPNPIGFFALLSLAAAWRTRTGGRPAWWAVAIGAAGAVTQLHVLGVVFLVAILALVLLELRRDRSVGVALLGGVGIVALLFVPLLAHELQNNFDETRGVLDYLRGDTGSLDGGPIGALALTLLRVVGWPLVGLVTDAPQLASILLAVTIGFVAWGLRLARGQAGIGYRWLVGLLVWSTVALAFAAPSLQVVVAGLPNDHYHAFVDPVVVILIAIPAASLLLRAFAAWRATRRASGLAATSLVAAGIGAILAIELARMPPWVDPDGGWARARDAGARIVRTVDGAPVTLFGLPDFKLPDAIGFPIEYAGGRVLHPADLSGFPSGTDVIVIACDRLFDAVLSQPCRGPAEDAFVEALPEVTAGNAAPRLVERFDASPRTSISIYAP